MHVHGNGLADIGGGILHDEWQVRGLGKGGEVIKQYRFCQTGERWRDGHEGIVAGALGFAGVDDALCSTLSPHTGEDRTTAINNFWGEMGQARSLERCETQDFTDHAGAAAIGAGVESPVKLAAKAGFVDGILVGKGRVHDGQYARKWFIGTHHQSPALPSRWKTRCGSSGLKGCFLISSSFNSMPRPGLVLG